MEGNLVGASEAPIQAPQNSSHVQKVQIESDRKGWARLMDLYHKYDEDRIRDAKEDIDSLLVFAGLFSAVLSTFVIDTYSKLNDDTSDTSSMILARISSQLESLTVSNSVNVNSTTTLLSSTSSSTPRSVVRINTLWSCSLVMSLMTASIGILVKQWFHEFLAQSTQDPRVRIRVRFFRSEGLERWQVFELAAALPLLLQIALLLFFLGLSEYLRELNAVVGWTTTAMILLWLAVFIFTTLAPLVSSQCPYQTPILKKPLEYLRRRVRLLMVYTVRVSRHVLHVYGQSIGLLHRILSLGGRRYFRSTVRSMKDAQEEIYRKTEILKTWSVEYSPEEEDIQRANDALDTDIIAYSVPFFLDEQLERTLTDCAEVVDVKCIFQCCDDLGQRKTIEPSGWRVTFPPKVRACSEDVIRNIINHKSQNPGSDSSWFYVLDSIMKAGTASSWWGQFPVLLIRLVSSGPAGAKTVMLALYSSLSDRERSIDLTGLYWDMGDIRYLSGLIRFMRFFIEDPDIYYRRSALVEDTDSRTLASDTDLLCRMFSILLSLASDDALSTLREDVEDLFTHLWRRATKHPMPLLPTGSLFIRFMQSDIESGDRSLFLNLYNSSRRASFLRSEMYKNCLNAPKANSEEYITNLLTLTESVKDQLWPHLSGDTLVCDSDVRVYYGNRGIKRDACAFCYTFCMLLFIASAEAIEKQKKKVRKLTSEILEMIEEDKGLVPNATKISLSQLHCSLNALIKIQAKYCGEATDPALISKLRFCVLKIRVDRKWSLY